MLEKVQCPLMWSEELRGLGRIWSEWLVRGTREWVRDDCTVLGPSWESCICDSLTTFAFWGLRELGIRRIEENLD